MPRWITYRNETYAIRDNFVGYLKYIHYVKTLLVGSRRINKFRVNPLPSSARSIIHVNKDLNGTSRNAVTQPDRVILNGTDFDFLSIYLTDLTETFII